MSFTDVELETLLPGFLERRAIATELLQRAGAGQPLLQSLDAAGFAEALAERMRRREAVAPPVPSGGSPVARPAAPPPAPRLPTPPDAPHDPVRCAAANVVGCRSCQSRGWPELRKLFGWLGQANEGYRGQVGGGNAPARPEKIPLLAQLIETLQYSSEHRDALVIVLAAPLRRFIAECVQCEVDTILAAAAAAACPTPKGE